MAADPKFAQTSRPSLSPRAATAAAPLSRLAARRAAIAIPPAVAAALALAYLAWAPPSTDLAAQTFRAELFADHGLTLWSNAWYGGHHIPGYSLLFPPLGALLGVRLAGALAAVAAATLFALLVRPHFPRTWLPASVWFAAGTAAWLLTGRMTFLLGAAFGLGALIAADRDRVAVAAALAALSALASPVAGLFTALAGAAAWLAGSRGPIARPAALALALGAGAVTLFTGLAFPTGGEQPFALATFFGLPLLAVAALWLVPREHAALRIGVVVYALLAVAVFVVPTPVGNNVTRLAALFAAPVALLVLGGRRPAAVVALACLPLAYWQLNSPVRDLAKGAGDAATERSFYAPLLAELDRIGAGETPVRVHVPPTENRWEAAYVAERYPLARGWLRQLESDDFELFRDGGLDAATYRAWLVENGVGYVAVPDAELDYMAVDEVALIERGLPYLKPVWDGPGWQLFEVAGAAEDGGRRLVAGGGARVTALRPDSFTLRAPRPGTYLARVRWSSYWTPRGAPACLERDGEWTRVELERRGELEVVARLSLRGVLGADRVCSA